MRGDDKNSTNARRKLVFRREKVSPVNGIFTSLEINILDVKNDKRSCLQLSYQYDKISLVTVCFLERFPRVVISLGLEIRFCVQAMKFSHIAGPTAIEKLSIQDIHLLVSFCRPHAPIPKSSVKSALKIYHRSPRINDHVQLSAVIPHGPPPAPPLASPRPRPSLFH